MKMWTSSLKQALSYLVLSDIHLGHRRTTSAEILKHLDEYFHYFSSETIFAKLDIIFIAGDLFDDLLDLSTEEIHDVQIWLHRLMQFCSRNNIILRILEGTPSHDWKQSKISSTVLELAQLDIDFKYVDKIEIERIESLGLDVLYIPDEATGSAADTFKVVEELLKDRGMDKVDIAIMHGMFSYQLGNIPSNQQVHDDERYLQLVQGYIHIGHIHTFSVCERIIAQGSFDRLAHGEEGAKGGVIVKLTPGYEPSFVFCENKLAKLYKTVTLRSKDVDKCYIQLDKALMSLVRDSYVKIKATKDHPLYTAFNELNLRYPHLNLSKAVEEEVVEKATVFENM